VHWPHRAICPLPVVGHPRALGAAEARRQHAGITPPGTGRLHRLHEARAGERAAAPRKRTALGGLTRR